MMAAPEPQPRFGQSVKGLLSEKVGSCSGDVITLTRQVLKGSRSQELLGQAARNMVLQEDAILHSEDVSLPYFPTASYLFAENSILRYFAIFREFRRVPDFQILSENAEQYEHYIAFLGTVNPVIKGDWITFKSLRKMSIITTHLQYQQEAIQKNVEHSRNLQDQLMHSLK